MVSEHLTINGFDSRVYLGAARAQAAAMRANGQKNQSRHTVLGGTTIDVQIQGSHTYIKIDAGGVDTWYFLTRVFGSMLYLYGTRDPLKAPKLLSQTPITYPYPGGVNSPYGYSYAIAPDAVAFADGKLQFSSTTTPATILVDTQRAWGFTYCAAPLTNINLLVPARVGTKTRALVQVDMNNSAPTGVSHTWESVLSAPVDAADLSCVWSNDAARTAAGWVSSNPDYPIGALEAPNTTPLYLGNGRVVFWYSAQYSKQGSSFTDISGYTEYHTDTAVDFYRAYSADYGTTWSVVRGISTGAGAYEDSISTGDAGVYGGVVYEQLGRYPGNVLAFEHSNLNADVVSGAVYESVDYGVTYSPIATFPTTHSFVGTIRVASHSWIRDEGVGNIFISTDNGATWLNSSAITPFNRSTVFVLYPSGKPFTSDNVPTPVGYISRSQYGVSLWVSYDVGVSWSVPWSLSAQAEPVMDDFGGNTDAAFSNLCAVTLANRK